MFIVIETFDHHTRLVRMLCNILWKLIRAYENGSEFTEKKVIYDTIVVINGNNDIKSFSKEIDSGNYEELLQQMKMQFIRTDNFKELTRIYILLIGSFLFDYVAPNIKNRDEVKKELSRTFMKFVEFTGGGL